MQDLDPSRLPQWRVLRTHRYLLSREQHHAAFHPPLDARPRPVLLRDQPQDHLVIALHPTVVISAATGAIGSATASVLARPGARVVLMARPSERPAELVDPLGGTAHPISSVPVRP